MSALRTRDPLASRHGRALVPFSLVVAVMVLVPAQPVLGQTSGPDPVLRHGSLPPTPDILPASPEPGAGLIAGLLGGIHGTDPDPHFFGGVNAGYMASRWAGGEGVVLAGSGGGYGSLLAGAGPTLRFLTGARGEMRVWVGGGWYRESLSMPPGSEAPTAIRGSGVATGGLQARIPAGPVGVTAGFLFWAGRFEEAGFVEPATFHGFRITMGVAR
jgi:hypothetical protein